MKKFILVSIMCLIALSAFSQAPRRFKSEYTTVDTFAIKGVQTMHPTRDGDYLITLPKEDNLVIAYNKDHTKAIVLHGYVWGKKMEFNVRYDETRLILWFKDKYLYCGYVYDTKHKACQYFEAINDNEKNRLVKRFKFLEHVPSFVEN